MPGPQVKNWTQYHALRRGGKSKESAARITNASAKKRKRRHLSKRRNRAASS